MTTNDIRTKFLNFFKSKGHSLIASDSLVPKDDPTVLFTTAGMQQFKPQFLGHIDGFTRAATCQKCLRTDDLDVVGKTDFHHTFFEMLGNFSFGDYFKKEAIAWAWEFLTVELKLPQDKLWVSVYHEDSEAYAIWADTIKIAPQRIVKLGDKSNFWPSNARQNGPNGPCGPCSEIFYDYGVDSTHCLKGKDCDPDCSCGRFSEVWNLVFTQFNRKDAGVLEPLPAKNIDTGMGLERLAAVVQGKKSNYETDNFATILKVIKDAFATHGAKATESEYRIIADHMRAVTIGIADGVIPSNEGRGYVMRKLIVDMTNIVFRAGIDTSLLNSFVSVVVDVMEQPYPELVIKKNEIVEIIKRVEESVSKLIKEKIPQLSERAIHLSNFRKGKQNTGISIEVIHDDLSKELGNLMFLYHDTHGLPMAMIQDELKKLVSEDILFNATKEENRLMEEQKNRSRAGSKMAGDVFMNQDFTLNLPKTEFLGYGEIKLQAQVLRIAQKEDKTFQVVLDSTPFYAESGGQVGDSGFLNGPTGKMQVVDTRKINDVFIHYGLIEGVIHEGQTLEVVIDASRRQAMRRNHTATHLLQAALREILGGHIKQQGSLVEEGRLRFDFTHPKSIKPEELRQIEDRINAFIQKADTVVTQVLTLEEAKKKGALAFFAEKYGQTVRVVSIGDYSKEFCGGTHVAGTLEIEAFKIISEGSVAQGIRRIEALTGKVAVDAFLNKKAQEAALLVDTQNKKNAEAQAQKARFETLKASVDVMIAQGERFGNTVLMMRSFENMDIVLLRQLTDVFKQKTSSGIFVLSTQTALDMALIIAVSDDCVARGIHAQVLIKEMIPLIQGTGGGKPQLAQAGSKNPQTLSKALAVLRDLVKAKLCN